MNVNLEQKSKGILLHISSLPSEFGIGSFGKQAYRFVDYLVENNFKYWQILPLNYPGFGDSPYNSISSFAGNPLFIDPELLFEQGLVSKKELQDGKLPSSTYIDFPLVLKTKQRLLKSAYNTYVEANGYDSILEYLEQESYWIKAFSVFCFYMEKYNNANWQTWIHEHIFYSHEMFEVLLDSNKQAILYHVFQQFVFDKQLADLKEYTINKGIIVIGDLPIYVSHDSCDVWERPKYFEIDGSGNSLLVSGVPPDAFSESGQLWGNPLYKWDIFDSDDYYWWKKRISKVLNFADKIRLDHFIGYVNYWSIESKEDTAISGKWEQGPKRLFFDSIVKLFKKDSFIAEDLGILTEEVDSIRKAYDFPGMIVLQFCFDDAYNDVMSFPNDRIIYTGTHDNHTTRGWFINNEINQNSCNQNLEKCLTALGVLKPGEKLTEANVSQKLMELAYKCPCRITIIPMQDILGLDDSARMNIPGIAEGNWKWRMAVEDVWS